jgi:hypothetical protein
MQLNKLVPAVVAVWVLYVLFDMLLIDPIMGSAMGSIPGANATPSTMWIVIGDLTAALVLALFYDGREGAFEPARRMAAMYGSPLGY